jgi:hypothetical protein
MELPALAIWRFGLSTSKPGSGQVSLVQSIGVRAPCCLGQTDACRVRQTRFRNAIAENIGERPANLSRKVRDFGMRFGSCQCVYLCLIESGVQTAVLPKGRVGRDEA